MSNKFFFNYIRNIINYEGQIMAAKTFLPLYNEIC